MPDLWLFRILAVLSLTVASARAGVIADAAISPNAQVYAAKPGPWGNVEWHYIYLEAPDWIVADYPAPNTQPSWCFPNAKAEKLRAFLIDAGLTEAKVDGWLADKRAILKGPEAITLFPSVADVEELSSSVRTTIYAELARSPQNEFHADPLRILDQNIDGWLGPRKVRPEIRQLFERLSYLRGDVLAFSDMSVLLSHAQDSDEAQDLMQLCTRTRAVMAYLHVDADTDMPSLAKYWSAGFRRKDVLPMLESVSQLPGGGRLGFAHLLPAEPRKLLYTYPTLDLASAGRLPDCHWTTLNFFNYRAQNVFLDLRLAASNVLKGYDKVQPPYSYGDALLFLNRAGDAIHSCTYLADDLVFSKNGETLTAPWVVVRIEDVKRIYGHLDLGEIQGYRRRWGQEP
jgi:hypothetical protein